MLLKLGSHISNCLERAVDAEHRAQESADAASRKDNELLAQSWRHLARSYEFVETLERFLSETNRNRKAALPPDLLAFADEPPAEPEGKPIIRRPRVRHQASFQERLMKSAQDARDRAAGLPPGVEHDRFMQKAQQSETAANIDAWVSSAGAAPPAQPFFRDEKAEGLIRPGPVDDGARSPSSPPEMRNRKL